MKTLILSLLCILLYTSPLSAQSGTDGFMAQYFEAVGSDALSFEDSVTLVLNAIRQHPVEFATEYLSSDHYDATNAHDRSLLSTLEAMSPISAALMTDTALHEMAHCHALSSGQAAHIGHDRIADCPEGYQAECINYGFRSALHVTIELLEDHGVADLSHRIILLSPDYQRIGVSQAPHKTYGYVTVMDFFE